MIIYDAQKLGGYALLGHKSGSALYSLHSLPHGLLAGVLAAVFSKVAVINSYLILHITSSQVFYGGFAFIVAFTLVVRVQIAMVRYQESQSAFFAMISSLTSLASMASAFISGLDNESILLRRAMLRWVKLFFSLAVEEFQGFEFSDVRHDEFLVSEEERSLLEVEYNRALIVMSWMYMTVSPVHRNKYSTSEPMLSRMLQSMTDVTNHYNETRRLAETPFPFPFAQVTFLIIHVWILFSPLFVATFIPDTYVLSFLFSSLSTWVLFAVNEVSSQLENPWEDSANDLPVVHYQISFSDTINGIESRLLPSFLCPNSSEKSTSDTVMDLKQKMKSSSLRLMSLFDGHEQNESFSKPIEVSPQSMSDTSENIDDFKEKTDVDRPIMFHTAADDGFLPSSRCSFDKPTSEPTGCGQTSKTDYSCSIGPNGVHEGYFSTMAGENANNMALKLRNTRERIRREIAVQAFLENERKRRHRNTMRHHLRIVRRADTVRKDTIFRGAASIVENDIEAVTTLKGHEETLQTSSIENNRTWSGHKPRPDNARDFLNKTRNFEGLVEMRSKGAFKLVF